jgi:hypothetical protein
MPESTIIRNELDQFVERLLERDLAAGWIGLELMTLGVCILAKVIGSQVMAEHCRRMAEHFEKGAVRIESDNSAMDNGYSAVG